MKKLFIYIIILAGVTCLGQSISSKVMATAGGTLTGGGNQISFTVGETLIRTLSAGNTQITQGFEQPNESPCPVITPQPFNASICSSVGATTEITVGISAPAASYLWQYRVVSKTNSNPAWIPITAVNANVYSGYSTPTLHITRTAYLPAAGTQYRLLLGTTTCGTLTSDIAALTVLSTAKAGTVSIPAHPAAPSACIGHDITFVLSNYAGTSFQWQSSPFSSAAAPGTFTDIPGATGTSYTLTNAQLDSDRSYRVAVTNSCNATTVFSATKTITVSPPSVAGIVTGGGNMCGTGSGTLKVTGHTGKIQWEYSTDGIIYINVPKAIDNQSVPFGTSSANSISTTYIVNSITTNVYFRAKITNGSCSSVYTEPVQYSLVTRGEVGNISPASTTVCAGSGTILTVSDVVGTITWEKSVNSGPFVNTTNHTATHATGNLTVPTAYRVRVSIGGCVNVYSEIAYITVAAKPVAKPITANTTVPSGKTPSTALCTTDVSKILTIGNGYVGTIQWQASTTSATTGFTDIAGAHSQSYTVIQTPFAGPNYSRAKFTNSCGAEVFSAAVTVYYKDCGPPDGSPLVKTAVPVFEVTVYPNPYTENFKLNLTTLSKDKVDLLVYDMTGRLLEKQQLKPEELPALELGSRYPSSVYNVVVTQGNNLKTLRIIKR